MSDSFELIFTKENADKVALDIINVFNDEKSLLDYDFYFKQGKFASGDVNTWLRFDIGDNELLKTMLQTLCDETIEATEERIQLFEQFRSDVGKLLETKYEDLLKKQLRQHVFNNKLNKKILPLKTVKVINFDISDIPTSGEYLLIIKKEEPKDTIPESVSKDLYNYMASLDQDLDTKSSIDYVIHKINEFVREKRDSEDKFKYVKEVRLKKSFFECQVEFFVDYTVTKPDDIVK